jgi:Transcriptional regulators containing a DNA-binding HTH domain and an aminotransferase domain (MocR family) and their eukaryotic orthologs
MKINNIAFQKNGNEALYIQLYKAIIQQMKFGAIKEGDQLPSIRVLAQYLNLSKTTIENTYNMLLTEGYIKSIDKVGYFSDVALEGNFLEELKKEEYDFDYKLTYEYDFSSKSIDKNIFDVVVWKKYLKQTLENQKAIVSYGDSQGEYLLRKQLAFYSYRVRNINCLEKNIIVGAGIQPLLYILAGLFNQSKLRIGMEESGFKQAQQVFSDCNFEIVKIKMNEYGIDLIDLKQKKIDILYLNINASGLFQRRINIPLRMELLKIAKANNFYIIEDDHNGELYYISRTIPAMQSFDQNHQVIYIGSFSKLLLPSIRIAYMILPKSLLDIYQKHSKAYNQTSSKIEQLSLAKYIEEGHLERHLKRLRKHYTLKSKELISYLNQFFLNISFELQEANLRIQLIGPFNKSINQILEEANKNGINLISYMGKDLLLSFSGIEQGKMKKACEILAKICGF